MKRIGKIFTLFLALMLCFIGCKNNEDDSSSKKIIATFEGEWDYESDEEEYPPIFINAYDDGSFDFIVLDRGKKTVCSEGIYEGNPEKDGFVNFITLKNYINGQKYDDEYVRIKNGKFNFRGMNFIRQ